MIRFIKTVFLFLLLLPALVLADQGSADSFGYIWTNNDGAVNIAYNWVDIQTGTSIFGSSFNDSLSASIPLPFSFTFYGTVRNQIFISSNGWLSFTNPGDTTYAFNDTIPFGGGPDQALAAYWDDLQSTPGNSGGVYYKTLGSSPNRQFVVEWEVINPSGEINFEIILFEHTNLIKFQYQTVGVSYGGGASATIGIKANTSLGNQYSVNQAGVIASGDAILFHNDAITSVAALISPNTGTIGGFETFRYTINNIDPGGAAGLGKLDRVAIGNPFSTIPSVIGVKINNFNALLQYSTSKPTEPGRATWSYNGTTDSLIVQTALFDVRDSVVVEFNQSIPDISAGSYPYPSRADAQIDISPSKAPAVQPSVTVASGGLDYLIIRDAANNGGIPVTSRTLTTDSILTLYAAGYDAADNFLGDQSVTWTVTGNLGGSGGSGPSFAFNPNVAPAFGTIEAETGEFQDATGGITVNVGNLNTMTIRTGPNETGIVAGPITMTTGDSQTFWAAGYDADLNYRGDEAATVWTSTLGIGGSGSSIVFSPLAPIIGTLTATVGPVNYTSGTITVNAGTLDYLIIRDAPNNGGSVVNNRTLTTDQSLTLYAAGYDAADNYLGDRDATWTVTGSLGASGSSGTSFAFNPAVAPAFGTIEADVGGIQDETGAITVNVGALASLTVRTAENEGGIEVTTFAMTTDQSQTFWAAGYDADGNYRGDETAAVWTSTLGISGSGASILFDPVAPVSGTLTDSVGGIFHTTGLISVTAGTISYLKIRDAANGGGSVVDVLGLTADQAITVYAAAYDAGNNFIADQTVDWSVTGTLDGPLQNSLAYTFSPALAPSSGSIVARLGTSHSTATGTITVIPGILESLLVRTASNNGGTAVTTLTMSTDETRTFWSAGYDADGNYRGDEATTVWTSTLGISGSGDSILFSPTVPISGTLTATAGGKLYTTGLITVNGGTLHHIIIRDSLNIAINDRAITADQQLKFFAAGFDLENNFLGNQVVNWTVTGSLDGLDQTGTTVYTFKPALAPASGSISASIGAINDATGTISVNVGILESISINNTPDAGGTPILDANLTTEQSLTMYAVGYDADNNFINPVNAVWSKTGSLDPVSGTASTYTFSPSTAPTTGTIVATFSGKTDTTGMINVVEGSIHHITIRDAAAGAGNIVTTRTLTADDSLTLYAAGYDISNNFITDVSVSWFSTGNLDQITASGPSYKFLPVKAPASGTIGAQTGGLADFTELITVNLGALSQIRINDAAGAGGVEVGNKTIAAGQNLTLYSSGYDADGNYRSAVSAVWGKTGTLDPVAGTGTSYTFMPQTAPSTGTIYGTGSGFSDTTGAITVTSGALVKLRLRTQPGGLGVVVGDTITTADSSLILWAAGYDANDNYLGDYAADWYSTGSLDFVNASGSSFTFNPVKAPAFGKIGATYNSISGFSGDITVNVGAIFRLRINSTPGATGEEFTTATLQAGQSVTLYAAAYDEDYNFREAVAATWSSTGTLDSVSGTGTSYVFTPITAPSSGTINASYLEVSDVTGMIQVEEGTLSYIRIRTAAGGGGVIVGDTAITADQTLTMFAAAYDASNNYLNDLTVSWSSTGTINNVVATGSTYTFNPVTAPTNGTIRITSGIYTHQTGTITVTVGNLHHLSVNNAAGAGGAAIGALNLTADQSVTLHAASYDADNNFIANVPAVWSQTGTLNTVTGTAASIVFSPQTAPTSGTIRITYLARIDDTGTITVSPGALTWISVNYAPGASGAAVGVVPMNVGGELTVYAAGYDQHNNYIGLEIAAWQTTNSLDPQTGVGESFTFIPQTANTFGTIMATVDGLPDETGTITVSQGILTSIKIRTGAFGSGVVFTGTTMTADQSLTLYAAGYDAGNNYLEDVPVTWTSTGNLNTVSLVDTSLVFSPTTAPTTGTIKAQSGIIITETGVINVTHGAAANIIDYNGLSGKRTTVAGSTQWIRVRVTDQHGNAVTGATVSFSPAQRVSDPSDVTDTNGLAETVFLTLVDDDSSSVQTTVTGLTPFNFTIYGIRYAKNPGLDPKIVLRGATLPFTVTVSNPGNLPVSLNPSATNISFSNGSYSYIATLQSPSTLPANNMSITLTFAAMLVNPEFPGGSYTPKVQLVGSGAFSSMNGDIYTTPGELTIGSDQITIGAISIEGPSGNNNVLQGDQNISAVMRVFNAGIPLPIDAFPATSLIFKRNDIPYSVDNLTRTDLLTTLPSGVETQLTFTFSLPSNALTGIVNVFGKLTLDDGNLPIEAESSTGSMQVLQSGNAEYVAGSLTPNPVVPRERVNLQARFRNTGSANIVLNRDLSTMEIIGSAIGPKTLISQFTLIGNEETDIVFNQMVIPEGLALGTYDLRWHLTGTLTNGSAYDSTAIIPDGIQVVSAANLRFTTVAVIPDTVRQGQTGIFIDYTIRNLGGSAANITSLDHNFSLLPSGSIPPNEWIPTGIVPELPNELAAGASRVFRATYALITNATTGTVQPAPIVKYHDVRTPLVPYQSGTVLTNDQVVVIKPASIKITGLRSLAPNVDYVNVNQTYNMQLTVLNNGADRIQYARVNILDNTQKLIGEVIFNDIASGDDRSKTIPVSETIAGTFIYTAIVDTAIDVIGNPVIPDQPDDRDEVIHYQLPSQLTIDARIESVWGYSDSLIASVDQLFTIQAMISNTGESEFKEDGLGSLVLKLPTTHFAFENEPSDSVRTFTSTDTMLSWTVRAASVGPYQQINFNLKNHPIDKNTNLPVAQVIIADDAVHVRNELKGAIMANQLSISQPGGAQDNILSTSQEFTVRANIVFNTSIAEEQKTAQILIPSDYSLKGGQTEIITPTPSGIAEWVVIAPDRSRSPVIFTVTARGVDKYSKQAVEQVSNNLSVQVIERADLSMNLDIVKVGNIPGDTLSVGQVFDLTVRVTNSGLAGIKQIGEVPDFGRIYIEDFYKEQAVSYVQGQQQDTLDFTVNQEVSWKLITNELLPSKTGEQSQLSFLVENLNQEVKAASLDGTFYKDRSERSREFSTAISEIITQSYDLETSLKVKMLKIPADENTDKPAFTDDSVRTIPLFIQDKAKISISDPTVPDTVSTGQTFKFRVSVDAENNLQNPIAYLILPQSFEQANGNSVLATTLLGDTAAVWDIKVANFDDYTGAEQESLRVYILGVDGNSGKDITSNEIKKMITIQIRPRIRMAYEIVEPLSARDEGEVSHGQKIKVNVWAEMVSKGPLTPLSYAEITSWGTIELDEKLFTTYGFGKLEGQNYTPNFTTIGVKKTFIMRAPSQNRTAQIIFRFSRLPKDNNSGLDIELEADGGSISLPISVVEKEITVSLIDTLSSSSTFTRGEGTHVLLAFNISNEGFQDSLFINRLSLRFIARTDTTKLSDDGVLNLIEWISVMNYEQALDYLQRPQAAVSYAEMEVDEDNVTNPLKIPFTKIASVDSEKTEMIIVMARFRKGTSSRSFRTVLTEVNAYDSEPLYPVAIIDPEGVSIKNNSLVSGIIGVTSNNPERTFGNFPNPFGRAPHETTEIRFLLIENSDVTLRIFSLAGELVRSRWDRDLAGLEGGRGQSFYYVTWDGTNDNGDKVLNGVYLCVIQISGSSGTTSYMTKIAYIK